MQKNILFSIIIPLLTMFLYIPQAEASNGVVELGSTNGSSTRCFALSTSVNRSNNFQVLIRCRNLIYPVEPTGMFYILWSNPIGLGNDSKPVLAGDMGFGDVSFNIQNSFSGLFITKEQAQSPSQPSNQRIMEGSIKPLPFLEKEPTPTRIPSPTIKPQPTIEPIRGKTQQVTPTPQPKGGITFFSVMQVIGILVIFVFVFTIIFYVISKLRR